MANECLGLYLLNVYDIDAERDLPPFVGLLFKGDFPITRVLIESRQGNRHSLFGNNSPALLCSQTRIPMFKNAQVPFEEIFEDGRVQESCLSYAYVRFMLTQISGPGELLDEELPYSPQ